MAGDSQGYAVDVDVGGGASGVNVEGEGHTGGEALRDGLHGKGRQAADVIVTDGGGKSR